ncbi:Growth arrest-specific protein 7 [Sciurus carolinensis]|uniref:Growth arrest-specific protein 7 n=1 Tax=Sciurus carolinensis TaxID=30640 RepID=A0AA41MMZ7_SCICA|nr:Growth arrest-specific protein 7 [Sciurus carolinensis]
MKTQQLEIKLSNKMEEDIKEAQRKSTKAGDDLVCCVDLYNQAQSKWFEEMVTTTLELERLEVERVEMIWKHLCQYTQLCIKRICSTKTKLSLWTNCFEKWTRPKTESCGSESTNRQPLHCGHGDLDMPVWPRRSCPGETLGVPQRGDGGSCWVKLPSHPLSCPLRREERAGNSRRVIWMVQLGDPKYSQAKTDLQSCPCLQD